MWQEASFTLGLHSEKKKLKNPELMLMQNLYWQKKRNHLLNLHFYLSLIKCIIHWNLDLRFLKKFFLVGADTLKVSIISALFKRALFPDELHTAFVTIFTIHYYNCLKPSNATFVIIVFVCCHFLQIETNCSVASTWKEQNRKFWFSRKLY